MDRGPIVGPSVGLRRTLGAPNTMLCGTAADAPWTAYSGGKINNEGSIFRDGSHWMICNPSNVSRVTARALGDTLAWPVAPYTFGHRVSNTNVSKL